MKSILSRIESFLLGNNVWLFLSLLFILNFNWVMLLRTEFDSIVYLSFEKWMDFLLRYLAYCLLFAPLLLFVGCRKWLTSKLRPMMRWGLWLYCFIIHPFMIGNWNLHDPLFDPIFGGEIIWVHAIVLMIIDLLLVSTSGDFMKNIKARQYLQALSLEKLLLLILGVFILLASYVSASGELGKALSYAVQYLIVLVVYYSFYLLNHSFLINKLFRKKGLLTYLLGFLGLGVLYYPFIAYLVYSFPVFDSWLVEIDGASWIPAEEGRANFMGVESTRPWWGMLLSIPLIVVIQWFRQNQEISHLEKEKSSAELSLLKQQINPHFFFNTLNNLYAMSLTKDEQTPDVILQLSELMRYVIYKGKEEKVSIVEEVKYIEDYIKLQQIRLHKTLDFQFSKSIENEKLAVPPLLFITLVENAFKHGIEPAEQNCYLHIHLKSDENGLVFTCKNSVEIGEESTSGIGLDNLKSRLNLSFPNRHELLIDQQPKHFNAKLTLNDLSTTT